MTNQQITIPVGIGDTVFVVPYEWEHSGIQTCEVTNIMVSQNKKKQWTKKFRTCQLENGKTIDWQRDFSFDDIGAKVFASKEEAELAIK